MMRTAIQAWGLALAVASVTASTSAADVMSAYTEINLDECLVMDSDDFGTIWACPGYKGMPMYVAEGDLRFYVSFGFGADDEPAATQTPPPFNTLGAKVEWRLSNATGAWRPVAAILRYFLDATDGSAEGQVLVVTQIVPDATCHVAYVDARANANANELAQQAADDLVGDFDCANDPETIGAFKAW